MTLSHLFPNEQKVFPETVLSEVNLVKESEAPKPCSSPSYSGMTTSPNYMNQPFRKGSFNPVLTSPRKDSLMSPRFNIQNANESAKKPTLE